MNFQDPKQYEKEFVNKVYDQIAPHFSHTRFCPWPSVQNWVNSLEPYSVILDIGCGNGRNLGINKSIYNIGTDYSFALCKIAKSRNFQIFRADGLKIPLRSGVFDHIIQIAVIHHFATENRRIQCLKEIARLLKINGTAYVTAWSTKQLKKTYTEQDQLVPWHVRKDFDKNEPEFERFYHLFVKGEFAILISQIPELELISEKWVGGNWEVELKRI